jgi:hypothetical protein
MSVTASLDAHEPSLETVEQLCERLAELGLAIGTDTARELARSVLMMEAPRVDARVREALDTALQTIRIAAQSAMGVLAATAPAEQTPPPPTTEPAAPPKVPPRTAGAGPARDPQPIAKRRPEPPDDSDQGERRPVFRRPRGR